MFKPHYNERLRFRSIACCNSILIPEHNNTSQGGVSVVLTGGGFKYNTGEGVAPISGSVSDGRIYVLDISFQLSNSREHGKYLRLSGGAGGV